MIRAARIGKLVFNTDAEKHPDIWQYGDPDNRGVSFVYLTENGKSELDRLHLTEFLRLYAVDFVIGS